MQRRDFIKSLGFTAGSLLGASLLGACHTEEDMIGEPNWILDGSFERPLPTLTSATNNLTLTARTGSSQLLKDVTTSTLSYNEGALGPIIRAQSGETVSVKFANALSEPSNIHWHGLVLPENMDGHPKNVAAPGSSIEYSLPLRQRAGTYWYHPHPHGDTARQVFMGLAGMFIVDDPEESALNLPSGQFEIPMVIQDKRFSAASLDYSPTEGERMTGYLCETIVVNGVHAPYIDVEAGWYRLRLLNGSTARVYNLALSNDMPFRVIGSDGGLLGAVEQMNTLMLGPGERADVLVDFSSIPVGQELFMNSDKFSRYDAQGRQSFSITKFKVTRAGTRSFTLPSRLSVIDTMPSSSAKETKVFDIAAMSDMGHSINGKVFDVDRIDDVVQAGTTEIWEFDNSQGDEIHPMHIHGVQFQVLDRSGGRNALIATEKGWKDTVLVMPGERVRVIMTFPQYKGVFVFHCHNLEHEDDGMMLNYRIE